MNRSGVCCIPQPGKQKSRVILQAFAEGAGGHNEDGPLSFYGVVGLEATWREARRVGEYFYLDNSFFDVSRGTHYRVSKNKLQESSGAPDWDRFKQLGIEVKPWKKGRHILVVMQSDHFMREVACWPGGSVGWQEWVLTKLKGETDRPIVVRHWSRDKNERARTLKQDLIDCHMLVTHASAAATEALLEGVPVTVTCDESAALDMSSWWGIEKPCYPENRCEWAAGLAAMQWDLEELRQGMAWRALA